MVTREETRVRVLEALRAWAKSHPQPSKPVLVYLGHELSVEDVVVEVDRGTEMGQSLVSFLEKSSKRHNLPVEDFIDRAIKANSRKA